MQSEITISDLLLRIYSAPESGSFCDHILSVLEDCVPAAVAGYSFTDLDTRTIERKVTHDLRNGNAVQSTRFTAFAQQHPFYECYLSNSMGPVITTTDIMSEQEWKATVIYNNLHLKYDVIHDSSIRFYDGNLCVSFCFSDPAPIDPDHRRLLNLIAPHLGNAYRAHHTQHEGIKKNLPDHMILVSNEGSVLGAASHAVEQIRRYFPSNKRGAALKLPEAVAQWVRKECQAWANGTWKVCSPNKFFTRGQREVLTFALNRHQSAWLISVEEFFVKRPFEMLMDEGLTQRESEILLWTLQGKKNIEIASILDIREATVRKHQEHILQKLGCETRGTAAQKALQILYRQSAGILPLECLTCTRIQCQFCH